MLEKLLGCAYEEKRFDNVHVQGEDLEQLIKLVTNIAIEGNLKQISGASELPELLSPKKQIIPTEMSIWKRSQASSPNGEARQAVSLQDFADRSMRLCFGK